MSARQFERLKRWDERLARLHDQETILQWNGAYAKASHWVGVLHQEGLTLEILPKLARYEDMKGMRLMRRNLLRMLSEAGHVPLRERDMAEVSSASGPLSETLILLFARRLLDQLVQGRAHNYETREENLHSLRGKLLMTPHVRHNTSHRERFFVARDEFTADNTLNRALKAACRQLQRLTQDQQTQDILRRCLLCLHGVSETHLDAQSLSRLHLDRRHARYKTALDLARMILASTTPGASAGKTHSYSLLFNMNQVFEQFVLAVLQRRILPLLPGVSLHRHAKQQWRYLLRSASTRRGILRLEPDILLTNTDTGQALVTLDTKWKLLQMGGRKRGAGREDLYQLYAYAQRYGCRHNLLLYPEVPHAVPQDFIAPSGPGQSESLIGLRFLDLRRDLKMQRRELEEDLLRVLGDALPAQTRASRS